jgi:hypothetical protein
MQSLFLSYYKTMHAPQHRTKDTYINILQEDTTKVHADITYKEIGSYSTISMQ